MVRDHIIIKEGPALRQLGFQGLKVIFLQDADLRHHLKLPQAFQISNLSPCEPSFLELCVNTGEHLKQLGEIDLTNAKNDGDLFGAVQERYFQIRSFRTRFWLLKSAAVSFVRVGVLFESLVFAANHR